MPALIEAAMPWHILCVQLSGVNASASRCQQVLLDHSALPVVKATSSLLVLLRLFPAQGGE